MQEVEVETEREEQPVSSATAEAYADLEETREAESRQMYEGDIEALAERRDWKKHGTPELYALWYRQILDDLITAFEMSGRLSVDSETSMEEVEQNLYDQFEMLRSYATERTDTNTTPCVKIRDRFETLQDAEEDELTLRVELRGPTVRFEILDAYIEQRTGLTVRTDASAEVKPAHEAGARETVEELSEEFVDYHNRPRSSYRHELVMSINKRPEGVTVSLNAHNERVVPTRIQRIRRFIRSLIR